MQMAESVRVPSPPNRSSLVLIPLSSSVSCRLTLPSVPFARVKLARLNRVRPQFREVDVAGISNARKDLDRVDGEQISSGVVIFSKYRKKEISTTKSHKRRQGFKPGLGPTIGQSDSPLEIFVARWARNGIFWNHPFATKSVIFNDFIVHEYFLVRRSFLLLFSFLFFFFFPSSPPLLHPFLFWIANVFDPCHQRSLQPRFSFSLLSFVPFHSTSKRSVPSFTRQS